MIPKTAVEHAQVMLAYINDTIAPTGVILKARTSNVIWLLCLGAGALAAAFDILLEAGYNSFNISLCDDNQILNLLPISGATRIPGSATTLVLTFTAASSGPMTVPAGTQVTISGEDFTFSTDVEITVLASASGTVASTCSEVGPNVVLAGTVTGLVGSLANFASVANASSGVSGADTETVSSIRTRLLKGQTTRHNLDGLAIALRSLAGIQYASVYYNYSYTVALTLPGGYSVPARHCMFVVQGTSLLLAKTYVETILAPSYGTLTQDYITESNQTMTISYEDAVDQAVYVKVYVDTDLTYEPNYDLSIKETLVASSGLTVIGQSITQEFILSCLSGFTLATITGAEVSADGITYGRTCVVSAVAIGVISTANITVIGE